MNKTDTAEQRGQGLTWVISVTERDVFGLPLRAEAVQRGTSFSALSCDGRHCVQDLADTIRTVHPAAEIVRRT